MTPTEQFKHVQDHVLESIEQIVAQLNRELHLAEIMRLNIAIHADNTIGKPITVTVVKGRGPQDD